MKSTLPKQHFLLPLIMFFVLIMSASCGDEQSATKTSANQSSDTASGKKSPIPVNTATNPEEPPHTPASDTATINLIKRNLSTYLLKDDLTAIPDDQRHFMFSRIDLNNDHRPEIFVGMTGSYFCGTGGCTAFLLDNHGKLITRFTVTEFPIVVRPHTTGGWRDLLIGTAAAKPSLRLVKWNGKKYPGNPSLAPAFSDTPSEHSTRVLNCQDHTDHWFKF